jgi:hypothetical protein
MHEETKDEYLARHKKENGLAASSSTLEAELTQKKPVTFKERLRGFFFLLLFAVFLWVLLEIFGMMNSN